MQNNFPKIPLFLSILFLVIFAFTFFFFLGVIDNNNKESQTIESEWQKETMKSSEMKMLDYSIKIIEDEKIQLETHFAQSSDIVPFLDTIDELAGDVSVKAEFVSVNILKDHTGLMVQVKSLGTFSNLYKFIKLLENSPYELEFISIEIHRQTELDADNKNVKIPEWNGLFKIKLLSFV